MTLMHCDCGWSGYITKHIEREKRVDGVLVTKIVSICPKCKSEKIR